MRSSRRPRYALRPVALVVWALGPGLALSQGAAGAPGATPSGTAPAGDPPLRLRPTPQLQEELPGGVRRQLPTFLQGDLLRGRTDIETVLEGNVELRRGDTVIRADRMEYYHPDDEARARGRVRINRSGNVFEGPELRLKVDAFEGFFLNPQFQILRNGGQGRAERAEFIDDSRTVVRNAEFSTCRREGGPSWMPAWVLRAASVKFDTEADEGVAENAVLRFQDVPILALPRLSFPLSDKRRSGWLPPTVAVDNVSGVEVLAPYYWNIAPNRDATITPFVMSRRGVGAGGEFRYLEPSYTGTVRTDWMPRDLLRGRERWALSASHTQLLTAAFAPSSPFTLDLSLNRVSDDNYWRDFPRASRSLTQRLLPSQASLAWAEGAWSAQLLAHRWQTLQDVAAPIVPPYDRLPQLSVAWSGQTGGGVRVKALGEYTRFVGDPLLTAQPDARRAHAQVEISRAWSTPGGYIVPTLKLQATNYQFDAPLPGGATSASRIVPTVSLDSGLTFERRTAWFGRDMLQTLEPRALYVYTPYRNQAALPVYDTAATGFNFASIFADDAFTGRDRVADNHLITLGATTRLIDPATGAEAARVSVAQRLRLADQNVTLPGGAPVTDRFSDILLNGALNWTPQWSAEGTLQFNPKTRQSERSTLGARYSPGPYRVVSAAYRLQRGNSEQLDIGWQWPLGDLTSTPPGRAAVDGAGLGEGRWYSVGRLNYSLRDRKLVDALVGLEYDGGCWIGRIVFERLQSSRSSATQRVMFQLEFTGFSRLGSSPLQSLQQNIPRYQLLRQEITSPSRFSNYD